MKAYRNDYFKLRERDETTRKGTICLHEISIIHVKESQSFNNLQNRNRKERRSDLNEHLSNLKEDKELNMRLMFTGCDNL